jgi:hypothetical protein
VALVATVLFACSSDEEGSEEQFCAAVADRTAYAAVFEGFDPTAPERALEQLRTARVELGELRDVAPSEIHDELDTEIDGVQQLIEALEGVAPGDSAAAVDAVRAREDNLADVREASIALETYTDTTC